MVGKQQSARQPSICRAGLLCCAHKRKMMKQDPNATSSNKFTVYSKVIITLTSRTSEDVADFMSWSNSVVPTVRNTLRLSISTWSSCPSSATKGPQQKMLQRHLREKRCKNERKNNPTPMHIANFCYQICYISLTDILHWSWNVIHTLDYFPGAIHFGEGVLLHLR